jgi:hypothetical protein
MQSRGVPGCTWIGFPCGDMRGKERVQRAEGLVAVLVSGGPGVWNQLDCGHPSTTDHVGRCRVGVTRPGRLGLD